MHTLSPQMDQVIGWCIFIQESSPIMSIKEVEKALYFHFGSWTSEIFTLKVAERSYNWYLEVIGNLVNVLSHGRKYDL